VHDGRGDSVHISKLNEELRRYASVVFVHRGMFALFAGSIRSGEELRSVEAAFKMLGYHCALAVWLILHASRDQLVYCRDWSVALTAELVRQVKGFRVIYEANSLAAIEFRMTTSNTLGKIAGILQALAATRANGVIAVTSKLARSIKAVSGRRELQIAVVPNAGDAQHSLISKESARERLGLEADRLLVGFVGNLGPWQGLPLLLTAFTIVQSVLSDSELLIVGDGIERQRLQTLAHQLGLSQKVRFTGPVRHELALAYIAACDVCTIPYEQSPLYEAVGRSPIKAYEYMACRRPIVAGSFDGLADELTGSGGGLVVPPDNPWEFAAAIVRILKDPVLARRIGAAGRTYVVTERSWSKVARDIVEFSKAIERGCVS